MKTFEHKGKTYIAINGKEFYLLQGFREHGNRYHERGLIFLQVAGRSPLHHEDLPAKNWEIVKAKTQQGVIYTAYDPAYFDYDTPSGERSEAKKPLVFIGRNKAGSLFLALYVCSRLLRIVVSENQLKDAVKRIIGGLHRCYPLIEIEDSGNEGNTAYFLQGIGRAYYEMDDDEFKELIEKPATTTNGRRKRR